MFLLLLLIAVLAFVLGIGLPTVSVYILTATLLAPALIKLGVTPMAAHMFVMYNGMLSMITPPVAFAAYAAANIARTDGWTTGWVACLVGWSTFILPFLFVLTPSLLMDGPAHLIVWNFCRILFGLFVGTAAIVGFALAPLSLPARLLYGLVSLPIVLPPESFAGGQLSQLRRHRRRHRAAHARPPAPRGCVVRMGQRAAKRPTLGCTVGSPPGLPGGGITSECAPAGSGTAIVRIPLQPAGRRCLSTPRACRLKFGAALPTVGGLCLSHRADSPGPPGGAIPLVVP